MQDLSRVDDESYLQMSESISKNILLLLPKIISEHCLSELKLGVYSPIQKEPLWFNELDANAYKYLIVHMHDQVKLSFHPVDLEAVKKGETSLILSESDRKEEDTPEVILVPGLAFTKDFERLGRGRGYFDQYLSTFKGVKIGLCFESQVIEDVFAEAHDIKMDYLITEKEIYCKK